MVQKCKDIAELKGIEALRMSYLFGDEEDEADSDRSSKSNDIDIPPLDIFIKNDYKKHKIP